MKKIKKSKQNRKVLRIERPRYVLNPRFEFFAELKNLVLKSSPTRKDQLAKKILRLGKVKLAVTSGVFINGSKNTHVYDTVADLFIVGDDINKRKLRSFLASVEADIGKEIRFSLMDQDEFQYRYGMFDRFIRVLLEGPHEKIINKLGL